MKVIPVIDILNGVAVHAIKGNRREYQPLKSKLCASSRPVDLASAFEMFGFNELYVADLNKILGEGDNITDLIEIKNQTSLKLMVDAGAHNIIQIQKLLEIDVTKVILGTETLINSKFLKKAIQHFGNEKIVVSLDMKAGKVQSKSQVIRSMTPFSLSGELQNMGVSEMILLDLIKVGSGEGTDFNLLKNILDCRALKVLVGGGVRDIKDLTALMTIGAHGVLIATALHSGQVSMEALRNLSVIS